MHRLRITLLAAALLALPFGLFAQQLVLRLSPQYLGAQASGR